MYSPTLFALKLRSGAARAQGGPRHRQAPAGPAALLRILRRRAFLPRPQPDRAAALPPCHGEFIFVLNVNVFGIVFNAVWCFAYLFWCFVQ